MSRTGKRAFTLAEMLIVIAIAVVLLSIGSVFWRSAGQRAAMKGALQGTISLLNYARGRAVSLAGEVRVGFNGECFYLERKDDDGGFISLDRHFCPSPLVKVEIEPGDGIVYLPSGGVEEKAYIFMLDKLGRKRKISVSEFTGKAVVSAVKN